MEPLTRSNRAERVRLRLGDGRVLMVQSYRPEDPAGKPDPPTAEPEPRHPAAAPGALPSTGLQPQSRPVIALIEAASAGADGLAALVAETAGAAGLPWAAIGLDRQNRLGARLGHVAPSPIGVWKQCAPELFVKKGTGYVVAGPLSEEELAGADVEAVLDRAATIAGVVVVDLGCRWAPRLFRPVLARATHIWLVVRAGQWSVVEMRLEQAEFSGWTDTSRLRLVVVGEGIPIPPDLAAMTAAVLPDLTGEAAREFLIRELGGANR